MLSRDVCKWIKGHLLLCSFVAAFLGFSFLYSSPLLGGKRVIKVGFVGMYKGWSLDEFPMLDDIFKERYRVVMTPVVSIFGFNLADVVIYSPHAAKSTTGRSGKDDTNVAYLYYTGEAVELNPTEGGGKMSMIKLEPDMYDLTMGFDYIDRPDYIRVPLYYVMYQERVDLYRRGQNCEPSKKKHFACFLVSNGSDMDVFSLSQKRVRLFFKLSLYKKVLSGGRYLNNIGRPVAHAGRRFDNPKVFAWLSNCKFVISYENTTYPGYNTEKPLLAYMAGSIPIYNAHPAGLQELNKNAMIYALDFSSEDALVDYIKKVDQDDELYCKIWNQKLVLRDDNGYKLLKKRLSDKIYSVIDRKVFKQHSGNV